MRPLLVHDDRAHVIALYLQRNEHVIGCRMKLEDNKKE